jgi:hypothetical protein
MRSAKQGFSAGLVGFIGDANISSEALLSWPRRGGGDAGSSKMLPFGGFTDEQSSHVSRHFFKHQLHPLHVTDPSALSAKLKG